MKQSNVITDGLLTSYTTVGAGPDILLLHGWGDHKETFTNVMMRLAEHWRVTALDLPGFGQSQAPKVAWQLADYGQFLANFVQKTSIQPAVVIGHSNGGALAIKAVAEGNLKPQKLILLAPSGVRNIHSIRKQAIKAVAKTGKAVTFWLPKSQKQKLQEKLYGTIGSDMLVAPHLQETFKLTVAEDIQLDASKLRLPVLLIYGDQDRATPVKSIGNRLHKQIQGSKLVVVPGADHFAHQVATDKVMDTVEEFLKT